MSDITTEGCTTANVVRRFLDTVGKAADVRHVPHPETGVDMNEVYEWGRALGMEYKAVTEAWKTFMKRHPNIIQKVQKLTFERRPDQKRNQATWAADGETLYRFTLDQKDSISAPFKDFAVRCGVLAAGGSMALQHAIGEMREAQAQLPDNHPARVFGRAAEETDSRLGITSPMQDPNYLAKRVGAADFFLQLRDKIRECRIETDRAFWTRLHGLISSTVLGMWPKEFTETHNIKGASSSRDYMTTPQIAVVEGLEATLVQMAEDYRNTDGEAFLAEATNFLSATYEAYRRLHGRHQTPTVLPEVREAFEALQAPAVMAPPPPAPLPPPPPPVTNNSIPIPKNRGTINFYFGSK